MKKEGAFVRMLLSWLTACAQGLAEAEILALGFCQFTGRQRGGSAVLISGDILPAEFL